MNVYDTANRLASELKNSEEYINYKMAKETIKLKSELQEKIKDFEKARYDAQISAIQTGKDDEEKLSKLLVKIDELKDKIGIKHTIKDYDISEKDFLETLDEMSEQAFDDQCTGANPRYPLIEEIKEIYLKVYYGGEK